MALAHSFFNSFIRGLHIIAGIRIHWHGKSPKKACARPAPRDGDDVAPRQRRRRRHELDAQVAADGLRGRRLRSRRRRIRPLVGLARRRHRRLMRPGSDIGRSPSFRAVRLLILRQDGAVGAL